MHESLGRMGPLNSARSVSHAFIFIQFVVTSWETCPLLTFCVKFANKLNRKNVTILVLQYTVVKSSTSAYLFLSFFCFGAGWQAGNMSFWKVASSSSQRVLLHILATTLKRHATAAKADQTRRDKDTGPVASGGSFGSCGLRGGASMERTCSCGCSIALRSGELAPWVLFRVR